MTISNIKQKSVWSYQKPMFDYQKWGIWFILLVLTADTLYSAWFGITMHTKDKCIVYQFLPRWLFLTYEYLIELFMVVIAGIFIGSIAEKYFNKYRKIMPRNQVAAFAYASLIPVCSCSAIPLIESMKSKLSLKVIITFVMAAPILNPYIIFLSYSVLGWQYAVFRILGAMVVAVFTGFVVEKAYNAMGKPKIGLYKNCEPKGCVVVKRRDIYGKTWAMVSKIAPYILVAALLGILLEFAVPLKYIESLQLENNIWATVIMTVGGVAIYLCNGADVLFLSPLMEYTDLGMGSALAFSLTSTAICTASIVMLVQFLGKKLTGVLVAAIVVGTVLFSILIGYLF